MNCFILVKSGAQMELFVCPCCKNEISSDNERDQDIVNASKAQYRVLYDVPIFYSYHEAQENGWFYTRDPKFCPPEKEDEGVWICPKCVKLYNVVIKGE